MKRASKQALKGFTLIELMIVTAIIGILAAVALPAYQDYTAKSQLAAGMAEISPAKVAVEEKLMSLTAWAAVNDISLKSSTDRCEVTQTGFVSPATDGSLICTMKGNAQVVGTTVTWARSADNGGITGTWLCTTTALNKLSPKTCPGI